LLAWKVLVGKPPPPYRYTPLPPLLPLDMAVRGPLVTADASPLFVAE
jgi:hypothetical protein